jgi:20S proteasome alpha/beta subunit
MTIAAGLYYRGGVILCADTELTHATATTHTQKIIDFKCAAGRFAFAAAGNYRYAMATIQKCQRRLDALKDPEMWLEEIEGTIQSQYQTHVLDHPCQTIDSTLHYWLLIAARPAGGGAAQLFATEQTEVQAVNGYACIGIGADLAQHLINRNFVMGMAESDTLYLASFVLANIKDGVTGCGGLSQFLVLRDDGARADIVSVVNAGAAPITSVDWIEAHSKTYEMMTRTLLFQLVDRNLSDADFESNLDQLHKRILEMRTKWRKSSTHEAFFKLRFTQ